MKIADFRLHRERMLCDRIRLAVVALPMLIAACTAPGTSPPGTSPAGTSSLPAEKRGPSTAPTTPIAPLAKVTGNLTSREPLALTANAMVTIQLIDVSGQDVAAVVLAEQTITRPGQTPIPFELEYDPDSIKLTHRYAVQARIEEGGKLRYRNDTIHFVLTHGNPNTVDLVVVPPR